MAIHRHHFSQNQPFVIYCHPYLLIRFTLHTTTVTKSPLLTLNTVQQRFNDTQIEHIFYSVQYISNTHQPSNKAQSSPEILPSSKAQCFPEIPPPPQIKYKVPQKFPRIFLGPSSFPNADWEFKRENVYCVGQTFPWRPQTTPCPQRKRQENQGRRKVQRL